MKGRDGFLSAAKPLNYKFLDDILVPLQNEELEFEVCEHILKLVQTSTKLNEITFL